MNKFHKGNLKLLEIIKMIDYNIFSRFSDKFKAQGFQNIDPKDPLVLEIEQELRLTGQFLHIADMIQLQLFYCSGGFYDFYGVKPGEIDISLFISTIHSDDLIRFGKIRSKLLKKSVELFENKQECTILSSNFKTKTTKGNYVNLLNQVHLCYTEIPYKTVLAFVVNTDISHELTNKQGYHYYVGTDESYFRYPDKTLLNTGHVFSKREFEILKCIAKGMESHEIAEKLFLSKHTINTHRRNILTKTGKRTTHEIVMDLMDKGVI